MDEREIFEGVYLNGEGRFPFLGKGEGGILFYIVCV
jgi:hypothetical protein